MQTPVKAEWQIEYDDGGTKVGVSYDSTSKFCPRSIDIEGIGEGVSIMPEDAAWLAARLLDAAAAIDALNPKEKLNDK